jgi:hypothetical protein
MLCGFLAGQSVVTCFSKRFKAMGERSALFENQCDFTGAIRLRLPEALKKPGTFLHGSISLLQHMTIVPLHLVASPRILEP